MIKLWWVIQHEYLRYVLNKRFWIALITTPLTMLAIIGLGVGIMMMQYDSRPVGYIDQSGLLNPKVRSASISPLQIQMVPYTSEEDARRDLNGKRIQAYFVLEADYLTHPVARLVILKRSNAMAESQIQEFVRANLLAKQPPELARHLRYGPRVSLESMDGQRFDTRSIFKLFVPFLAGYLFMGFILGTSSYLIQAVVEEKENRTMEILITSISPGQLMYGKILGLVGVGLTQMLPMLVPLGLLFLVASLVGYGRLAWDVLVMLAVVTALMLPTFVLATALLVLAGSFVSDARQGSSISSMITLPFVLPAMLFIPLMGKPNSSLAVGLSLFPLTAPFTITIRMGLTQVPVWQIATSIGLLWLTALGTMWLSSWIFRRMMLRYSIPVFSLRRLFARKVQP